MRDLVFLPDREGRDELTNTTGFVRLGGERGAFAALARSLVLPGGDVQERGTAAWRGLLATALLWDVWPEAQGELTVIRAEASSSSFAAWVLAAQPTPQERACVQLAVVERDGKKKLMGIVDAEKGIRLPASPGDLTDWLPERVLWYDREEKCFLDPLPYLTDTERRILLDRLTRLELKDRQADAFITALSRLDEEEKEAVCSGQKAALARLSLRFEAVCGLMDFDEMTVEERLCAPTGKNGLLARLMDEGMTDEPGADRIWSWRGVPFAQTHRQLGMTGAFHPEENAALKEMQDGIAVLGEQSMKWNRLTAQGMQGWLDRHRGGSILKEVYDELSSTRRQLAEKGAQVQPVITMTWPWDTESSAVRFILKEALGEAWMNAAAAPFADRLTKLTAFTLGDRQLQNACACADGVLVPPLSREMAACVAGAEEGAGLAMDALRFQPRPDGGIEASFLLRGEGEVRMIRVYAVDELLVLSQEESPTVAVWPCLPLERWHAYHVFTRGGAVRTLALCGGEWQHAENRENGWACLQTDTYPACLVLEGEEGCLGALPNMLPLCRIEANRSLTAAVSIGSTCTVCALGEDGKAWLPEGQELTRLLTAASTADVKPDPLLMSLKPGFTAPTAVVLTGKGTDLFRDGYVCRVTDWDALADMEPSLLRTRLKWRADAATVRARRILLHQMMLNCSLAAMLEGAASIRWRITIADEMAEEGRQELLDTAAELAQEVAKTTGLPLASGDGEVLWAEESPALYAGLKGDGGLRGSFMALDLGGGSTKLHLWLQGQSRPLAGAVLLEGTQTQLFAALRKYPELLLADFADCADNELQKAVQTLHAQLSRAGESHQQADKAELMLNLLMDAHRLSITRHLTARTGQQRPAYMQAILLETYAAAMFIAGLMLQQAGENTLLNHRLPDDLGVCLSGRGAWMLQTMTPQTRNSLQHITRSMMRVDHPVRFITLRTAPDAVAATALGMAVTKDTQHTADAPAVRTRMSFSELMCIFMRQFAAAFPVHHWMLHEGMFDAWGNLSPEGEDLIRRTAAACYGDGEDIPASVMDCLGRLRLVRIEPKPPVYIGE